LDLWWTLVMTAPRPSKHTWSRRKVSIDDDSRWVFNRMAGDYDARPAYPAALVDAVAELARPVGRRLGDVGAGIGHLAIPLAQRGFAVTAVEPARAMLKRLEASAAQQAVELCGLHGAAEALPLPAQSLDIVLIADALHFIDPELAAREIARVLVPRGLLVLVTCEPGATPFMREVVRVMRQSAQRQPRSLISRTAQLAGGAKISLCEGRTFTDETPVTQEKLERILSSISFIGPAMNPERTAAFRARVQALTLHHPSVWARHLTLRWGRRTRSRPSPPGGPRVGR
jgi:ubiquinone/menaquinone biosynthesis C-methylase UbiE